MLRRNTNGLTAALVTAAALVCALAVSGYPSKGAAAGPGASDPRPPTQLADSHEFEEVDEGPTLNSPAKAPPAKSPEEGGGPGKILTAAIPKISGPKRTIAVGKFGAIGAFTAKYGNWDIGGGLSAMMTTALVESRRFIVVERANLQQVLSEKELMAAGLTSPGTGPGAGKLTGVQLLVYGSVTEFGVDDEGGGVSLGFSGGGLGSLFSSALSQQSTSGTVAIDIRLVDSTSGQILETHRLKDEVNASGWDLSVGYQGISLGTNQFYKTPLGQAVRNVITRAVQRIAVQAQKTSWTGQVVDFDGKEVYINAGTRSGLNVGDKFMIERVIKRLTDPTTNEVLSLRKKELGIVQISGVEKKISYGPFMPLGVEPPKRGDFVAIIR